MKRPRRRKSNRLAGLHLQPDCVRKRTLFLLPRNANAVYEFRQSTRGEAMRDISQLAPRERAERYRELAQEARIQGAMSQRHAQEAFERLADKWERLARETEDQAEDEKPAATD